MTPPNKRLPEPTTSLCPVCLSRVEAVYVRKETGVYMEKTCPEHGGFSARVWADEAGFLAWQQNNPTQPPKNPARDADKGCPYDCGLCTAHRQATCCVLLELTARCNLGCPVCFASAQPAAPVPEDPGLEQIEGWYDMLMARGGPFNIQLSGGEPTLREDLDEIIRMGRRKGFGFFQLNTNGLRIASQPAYLRRLARAGLNTVFLQFDTLNSEACTVLRGRDIIAEKKQAIRSCAAAGVGVVLVPTLRRGCNDGELGALLDFAAANMPTVRGVHFQPISYFGRYGAAPAAEERLTIPDLLAAMEAQTGGRLRVDDFRPGGAEHPLCSFHADYRVENGHWTLHQTGGNTGCCSGGPAHTSDAARSAVAGKWSAPAPLPALTLDSRYDFSALDTFLIQKTSHTLAVSGMAFQDAWTVDLQRLARCYIHVVSPAGQLVPFCAYNLTAQNGAPLHRPLAQDP